MTVETVSTSSQPIAGVAPPETREVTIMVVWPSIAATGIGRKIGQLCQIKTGYGVVTIGNMMALLFIPVALAVFFGMLVPLSPWGNRRYRLTNRRIMIEHGLRPRPERWVDLDRFEAIELEVLPGQEWYPAGDLVFRKGATETFRLAGVPHPESFRRTCLKAMHGYVGVQRALAG